jgi:hypothetical protein
MNLIIDPPFERLRIDPSTRRRVRYFALGDRGVIELIDFGILFVTAWWSGTSRCALAHLRPTLDRLDPGCRLDLAIVDTDGAPDLHETPGLAGTLHGHGETAWVDSGRIVRTSGIGFNPACFAPYTLELLSRRKAPTVAPALHKRPRSTVVW